MGIRKCVYMYVIKFCSPYTSMTLCLEPIVFPWSGQISVNPCLRLGIDCFMGKTNQHWLLVMKSSKAILLSLYAEVWQLLLSSAVCTGSPKQLSSFWSTSVVVSFSLSIMMAWFVQALSNTWCLDVSATWTWGKRLCGKSWNSLL